MQKHESMYCILAMLNVKPKKKRKCDCFKWRSEDGGHIKPSCFDKKLL